MVENDRRVGQTLRIGMKVIEVLGSEDQANIWLLQPNSELDGYPPGALLRTAEGRRRVEEALDSLAQRKHEKLAG